MGRLRWLLDPQTKVATDHLLCQRWESHSTLRATLKVVLTVWVAYFRGGVFRSGGLNSARNRSRRSAEYQTGAYSSSNWQTSANRRCASLNRRFSVLSILDVGCFAVTIWNVNWVVLLHNNSPQVGPLQARSVLKLLHPSRSTKPHTSFQT